MEAVTFNLVVFTNVKICMLMCPLILYHPGVVDVNYVVEGGNISALASNESLATPGIDFVSEGGVVRLEDGQQSAVIPVSPLDDVDPELDEVFLVRLTSVTLVGEANNTILPSIGADNVREVVIVANDSPQGEMTFQQES